MVEILIFKRTNEIKKALPELKKRFNLEFSLEGKKLSYSGDSLEEYEASMIIDAINFGFTAKKALLLTDTELQFKKINIKDFTRRKNLHEVIARVIGTQGKTKKTIEQLSECFLEISEREVGIIGEAEAVEKTTTAITSLIRGSKQANVYAFLENMNKVKKEEALGLKD